MCLSFSLVYRLVGKVKEVKDNTAGADNTYYTSLLNTKTDVCFDYYYFAVRYCSHQCSPLPRSRFYWIFIAPYLAMPISEAKDMG